MVCQEILDDLALIREGTDVKKTKVDRGGTLTDSRSRPRDTGQHSEVSAMSSVLLWAARGGPERLDVVGVVVLEIPT